MSQSVACVMLTPGNRERFAARARRCFGRLDYAELELVETITCSLPGTIGDFRNVANARTADPLIAHWDDDDVNLPGRIAHQVALLESTGADLVGYRDLLFYDSLDGKVWYYQHPSATFCVGTSMLYRRQTWERVPFPSFQTAEDTQFLMRVKAAGMKVAACSSIVDGEPLLIAELHDSNTHTRKQLQKSQGMTGPGWTQFFQPAGAKLAERVRELMAAA